MKLSVKDLNSGPYLQYPTNTYIYGVTTTPRMCDDKPNEI